MKANPEKGQKHTARRTLLTALAGGAGFAAARGVLPDRWAVPLVQSVTLPAHASSSPVRFSAVRELTAVPPGFLRSVDEIAGTLARYRVGGTTSQDPPQGIGARLLDLIVPAANAGDLISPIASSLDRIKPRRFCPGRWREFLPTGPYQARVQAGDRADREQCQN